MSFCYARNLKYGVFSSLVGNEGLGLGTLAVQAGLHEILKVFSNLVILCFCGGERE